MTAGELQAKISQLLRSNPDMAEAVRYIQFISSDQQRCGLEMLGG